MKISNARLPKGWIWTSLGEMAQIQGGIQKGKKRKPGVVLREVPYLRVANVQRGYLDLDNVQSIGATEDEIIKLRLLPGDVLFNEGGDRDKLGRGWVWRGEIPECIHQNHVFRARLEGTILPKLLSWYGNSEGQKYFFDEGKQTTNLASLNSSKLKALPLVVPPLPEQHRIVEAIESYFTRLEAAEVTLGQVQRNLKRYRASVLKAAVEGRLVPTEAELARGESRDYEPASVLLERILAERRRRWEEAELVKMKAKSKTPRNDKWKAKYKEPVAPDTTDLPELPEGWCWTTAEALSDAARPITYGVIKLGGETPDGIPVLRSSNVRHLHLDQVYVKPVSEKIEVNYQRTRLLGREVLVTVRGTLGGVVVVPENCRGFNISREVAMVALVDEHTASIVATFVASPILQVWMLKRTKGITYRGVNIETLKRLPIPLPPYAEQGRIVADVERYLSVSDEASKAAISNTRRCTRLRQAILKWAFEGKLADQDLKDEPASVLLDRIRAERETAGATKRTTRRGRPRKGTR